MHIGFVTYLLELYYSLQKQKKKKKPVSLLSDK